MTSRGRPQKGAPERDTFGFRLRSARLSLGAERGETMGQEEFAALVAIELGRPWHQTRLSRLEQNSVEPSLAEALACAAITHASVTWLCYGFEVPVEIVETDAERQQWLEQYRGDDAEKDAHKKKPTKRKRA